MHKLVPNKFKLRKPQIEWLKDHGIALVALVVSTLFGVATIYYQYLKQPRDEVGLLLSGEFVSCMIVEMRSGQTIGCARPPIISLTNDGGADVTVTRMSVSIFETGKQDAFDVTIDERRVDVVRAASTWNFELLQPIDDLLAGVLRKQTLIFTVPEKRNLKSEELLFVAHISVISSSRTRASTVTMSTKIGASSGDFDGKSNKLFFLFISPVVCRFDVSGLELIEGDKSVCTIRGDMQFD